MKKIFKNIKENKIFISLFLVALIIQVLLYVYVILNRQYIYTWDNQIYYKQQVELLNIFQKSFFEGLKNIVSTTYNSDYGNFLLLFTSPIFALTNKTPNAFVFTYMAIGVIPTLIIFAMILKKIVDKCDVKNKALSYIIGFIFLVTFQNTIVASIKGQPDSIGLFWAGLIIYLLLDIDFKEVQKIKWGALIFSTFSLVITRRWYMFLAVGIWFSFGIIELCIIFKSDTNKKVLFKNFFKFVVLAIIIDGILVSPIIRYTLNNNYSNSYKAWNLGGLGTEIKNQIAHLGLLECIILLVGAVYGLIKKDARTITLIMLFTYIIEIILFTRIQNMGYHQMLILCPTYIIILFNFVIALDKIKINLLKYDLQIATIAIIVLNLRQSAIKYQYSKFLTDINYTPQKISNYEQIKKVHNFIVDNCDQNNKAYINAAGKYCKHTFSNFNLPEDLWLENVIPYECSVDGAHGFPIDMLDCKYVFITNVVDESTGAVKGHIIPGIMNGIKENEVIRMRYKLIKTFDMNDGIIFYCYERIAPYDEEEKNAWMEIFSDVSEIYPKQFNERISNL